MKNSKSESYAAAGVDITAGYKAVELMKAHIARTIVQSKPEDIGGFGGLFTLDLEGYKHPILVSGTDGVGTKLKMAFLMDKHEKERGQVGVYLTNGLENGMPEAFE